MKFSSLFSVVAMAATLAACGGGGGGDSAAPTEAAPSTSVSKYIGIWVGSCEKRTSISIASTPPSTVTTPAYTVGTLKDVVPTSDTSFTAKTETQIFDNAECTGPAKATNSRSSSVTIDSTKQVNGKTADKISFDTGSRGGGISAGTGSTINVNGIIYSANYFTDTDIGKGLLLIDGDKLYGGDRSVRDASGYPATIDFTSFSVKQ
jgi:hypothetical protein